MCLPEQINSCALCNEKQKKQKEKELERLGCSAKGKKCSSIETKTKRKGITSICRPLVSQPSCVCLSFFFPLSLLTVNALLFRTKTVSPNSRRSKTFRYADVLFCCMLFFFFFFFKIHEKRNKKKRDYSEEKKGESIIAGKRSHLVFGCSSGKGKRHLNEQFRLPHHKRFARRCKPVASTCKKATHASLRFMTLCQQTGASQKSALRSS